MRRAAIVLALLLAAAPPARGHSPVRGMTISCHTWGWEWGTDEMVASMRRLRDLGVNWIAIHPYAAIGADGTVATRRLGPDDDVSWLTRPIEEAHRLGLEIMIKPHLAYWGSPFSWRGEIAFENDAEWARFFATYEAWIARLAEICADADAFVVGTELDRTVDHEAAWRRIVAAVRARTPAHLTYSANWDAFERVRFWDALDAIGIQSYFPLVEHDGLPDPAELDAGWARILDRLEPLARATGKPVVLAELGYDRAAAAARRPWEPRRRGEAADEEIQRRCLDAALRAVAREDEIVGAFLWKWFPGEQSRGNFLMSTPAMQGVIRDHWAAAAGPAAAPVP